MFAKTLSNLLVELCSTSDVTTDSYQDMDLRFQSLRDSAKLPQGRENRGVALTDEHIVNAILGLVASKPGWAGMSCLYYQNLNR